MTAAGLIELTIDEKAHNYAKIYSSLLSDEFQRKRAYASLTALYALVNLLEKTNNDIQKTMTIFRNPVLNEQYEISDIYINDWHIDVRIITDGNAFLVPKCHFENNIVPDYYAVIRIDKKLETADLIGFADTKTMQKEGFDYHYFSVSNKNLLNYAEFLSAIASKKQTKLTEEDHNFFKSSYLSLMDNEIDKYVKIKLLKHLFECSECRTEFCCFTGFEMVNCNLSKYPEILEDQTLNIIGAQAADSKKYEGKEETIYIGDEEQKQEETPEKQESSESTDSENKQDETDKNTTVTDNSAETENSIDETSIETSSQNNNDNALSEFTETDNIKTEQETEETVSDILDELFGDEDPPVQYQEKEEKQLTESSLVYDDDKEEDLTIISDDNSDDMEIIPNDEDQNTIEIESTIIEEVPEDTKEELIILDSSPLDETQEMITETPTLIEDTQEADMVQKVIVDYDDFGEPIYSYITNVNNPENDTEISEIEPINDDLSTSEDIEEINYPLQEDESSDLTEKNIQETIAEPTQAAKISARPVDYYFPPEDEVQETVIQENDNLNEETIIEHTEEMEIEQTEEQQPSSSIEEQENSADLNYEEETSEKNISSENNINNAYNDYDTDNNSSEENIPVSDYNETNEENNEDEEYDEDYDSEYDDEDDYDEQKQPNSSKKTLLVASFIILLLLSCGGAFFLMKNINAANTIADNNVTNQTELAESDNNAAGDLFAQPEDSSDDGLIIENSSPEQQNNLGSENTNETTNSGTIQIPSSSSVEIPSSGKIEVPGLTEKDLLKQKDQTPTGDVNKVMSNAFANGSTTVTIRGVNWQCAPTLFTDKEFKSYLQNLDNVLKLNLRKNILDATENAKNNSVSIKMAIDNEGNLLRTLIADSSGSDEIDNIVLQSIKETLESQKTRILSDDSKKADKYYLQVVIKL